MIHITEKAALKVKEIADDEGIGYYSIRVKCIGSGCAGFSFDLCFDDQIKDNDEVSELDGVKVICDEMSLQYMDDTVVDYETHMMGGGFKFNNPKSTGSCGCGSSFSVD